MVWQSGQSGYSPPGLEILSDTFLANALQPLRYTRKIIVVGIVEARLSDAP